MLRLHIVGRKNSGKTTLIVDLVRELTARGLKVGTIKHTHHHHELDTPGKDSFQHREAGATAVGIVSPRMDAVFRPRDPREPDADRYAAMATVFADCDLVLVEGDSQTNAPKVEVWRAAATEAPISANDDAVIAIITDDNVEVSTPVWPRSNITALASRLQEMSTAL